MGVFFWTSTSSNDPTLGANWTKSDGTSGTAPGAGDDVYIQAIPGLALASIWAAGGDNISAPGTPTTSAGSSTGGNLAQSTSYYYKVAAFDANGEGALSGELTYAVGATGTATNQITLTWTAPTTGTPTGYKIYRGTASGAESLLAIVGAVLTYADTSATIPAGSPPGSVFNSLTISSTSPVLIGAAGPLGYWHVAATTWTIGTPSSDGTPGSGSGRIKLDFGSTQFTGTVIATGATVDIGYEPVRIKGSNASNVLYCLGGRTGVATNNPGETATLALCDVTGAQTVCDLSSGVTWTNANVAAGGTLNVNSGSTGTLSISTGALATAWGTGEISTVDNGGTATLNNRPASGPAVGILNNYTGGTSDFSGDPAAVTVTTLNQYSQSIVSFSAANPQHLTVGTWNKINTGSLQAA